MVYIMGSHYNYLIVAIYMSLELPQWASSNE